MVVSSWLQGWGGILILFFVGKSMASMMDLIAWWRLWWFTEPDLVWVRMLWLEAMLALDCGLWKRAGSQSKQMICFQCILFGCSKLKSQDFCFLA